MTDRPHASVVTPSRVAWPWGPVVTMAVGLAILALPGSVEGPPIVPISPGHALSAVDLLGVLPLAGGSLWLHAGLWRRRARLALWARGHAGAAAGLTFGAGLGLGFLLASAFSAFYWWWAVGAMVFTLANVAAVLAAAGGAESGKLAGRSRPSAQETR